MYKNILTYGLLMFVLENEQVAEQESHLAPREGFEPLLLLSDEKVEICYSNFEVEGWVMAFQATLKEYISNYTVN